MAFFIKYEGKGFRRYRESFYYENKYIKHNIFVFVNILKPIKQAMTKTATLTVIKEGKRNMYPFDLDDINYIAFLEKGTDEDSEITVGVGGKMFLLKGEAARDIHYLLSKK